MWKVLRIPSLHIHERGKLRKNRSPLGCIIKNQFNAFLGRVCFRLTFSIFQEPEKGGGGTAFSV